MNVYRPYFKLKGLMFLFLCGTSLTAFCGNDLPAKRAAFINHIETHFAEQLTNPQKKNRKSLSQFGYNLSSIPFPVFPITRFINPAKFGLHSYGKPDAKEHNGSLYTCRGGFMDFSHLRCAADWTVYLTFKIITANNDFDLEPEAGSLKLKFQHLDRLTLEDVVSMAQKITFERLIWHEVASWHYHLPNYGSDEQQSTFTPEDLYSDFLGAVIGRNIALRILRNLDTLSYSKIATEEVAKTIASLHPLTTKKASAFAYDIVDRSKQLKLPTAKRNADIWWDSRIIFSDERYCFKRSINTGPEIDPWLVPYSKKLGCPVHPGAEVLLVPERTLSGVSFYDFYEFTITPDSALFYSKMTGKELHILFAAFNTRNFNAPVAVVYKEMEQKLLPGFDKRNSLDPVPSYKSVTRVLFKW
jgi:hypothetical protein